MAEKILPKLSLISIFFLICGIIKINIFYSNFNIRIIELIDLTEFTVLFIDDIFFSVICMVSPLIYLLIANTVSFIRKKTGFDFKYTRIGFGIIIINSIFKIDRISNDIVSHYISLKTHVLIILLCLIIIVTNFNIKKSLNALYIMSALLIFISSIIDPFVEENIIKKHISGSQIEITFNNEEIIRTDDNNKFIGRTKSFIFLYDVKEDKSSIYNNDDVKVFTVTPLK